MKRRKNSKKPPADTSLPVAATDFSTFARTSADYGAAARAAHVGDPCVVLDPLDPSNNVAKSVTHARLRDMQRALRAGRARLAEVLAMAPECEFLRSQGGAVGAFFPHCKAEFGRGDRWRPDHLAHVRERWPPPSLEAMLDHYSHHPDLLKSDVVVTGGSCVPQATQAAAALKQPDEAAGAGGMAIMER